MNVALMEDVPPGARARPTVLVVDDEPDIGAAVRMVLEGALGVRVVVASSGPQGLSLLESSQPVHLIISDFKMPGMNGLEFLRRALEAHPTTPTMLITAFERELVDQIDESLARTVLTKPLDPRPMVKVVQKLLASAA
jgi:CheY-like chemotaxis protein